MFKVHRRRSLLSSSGCSCQAKIWTNVFSLFFFHSRNNLFYWDFFYAGVCFEEVIVARLDLKEVIFMWISPFIEKHAIPHYINRFIVYII